MGRVPVQPGFFKAFSRGTRDCLHRVLRSLGQIIDGIAGHRDLFRRRVSSDSAHEAEPAHPSAHKEEGYPDKATPEQARRTERAKARKKAGRADDKKYKARRNCQQPGDTQEIARPLMLASL